MKSETEEDIDYQNELNREAVELILRALRRQQQDPHYGDGVDEYGDWLDC